jgi:hypothetical protein
VHWRALPIVPTSQVNTLFLKEVERYWLISLRCHMHNVNAEVIASIHIGPMLQKQLD